MKNPPLLIFADDWGRHPSSCQHLIHQLLDRYHVTWVNTIGTRTPKFDRATLLRALGKLGKWFRSANGTSEELPKNLKVVHPKMWPWFTHSWDRWLNQRLLRDKLRPEIEAMSEPPIAITTLPIVADLMGHLPVKRWIYYCVDDFSQWPGLDGKTLGRLEGRVVEATDVVIAASVSLRDRLSTMGRESELLTHGVDVPFWKSQGESAAPNNQILFWGVIDQRMDTAFLRQLANDLTEGTILLAGPEQSPDVVLRKLPRTKHLGPVPFADLPALAHQCAVLVMPYADLPVTRLMQPLKLKEYLATGLPVVVRDLPANREWADCLDLVDSPEGFSELVRRRVRTGLPESQRIGRNRLAQESWSAKSARFEELILDECRPSTPAAFRQQPTNPPYFAFH